MILALPTGPRGRLLAVSICLLTLLLLWLGIASPLIGWFDARAERLSARAVLADHMQALADAVPALRRQAAAAQAANRGPGNARVALLEGSDDAVAGAALQERVQRLADGAGVTLASVETLPVESVGAYRRIGLHLTVVAAGWPALVRLLQLVEDATPHMLIDDLQVHGRPSRDRSAGTAVDANFDVLGYRLAAAGPSR